ncbi:hypothetical protein HMI54_008969 [Coelomomyces lativittatus]|nr:hypothetical protein HMI54_008969 [Coelomomyces lativittatus]
MSPFLSTRSLSRSFLRPLQSTRVVMYSSSSGNEGSIRSAGGSFAKKEAAVEDQYIRKLVLYQLYFILTLFF